METETETGASAPGAAEGLTRGQRREEGLRWFADFIFQPFLWVFVHAHISPNLITILGMALAIVSGYLLATGYVPLAAVFFTLSGILDLVDGYVAKKMDMVSVFGSFLDSVSDRVSDAAIYTGLMVYYLKRAEGMYVGVALAVFLVSFLISYVRARAEALDVTCRAGLMSRPVRMLLLAAGLFFNGLSPWVLKVTLWILLVMLAETLVSRLVEVWRAMER
ncbi:MAG: CDP-alcohol phosphatidyltransferase family protein [Actinobacteria bacterium]|nr:CDP-alcohol phosphatidyltransferase family protein [Actinomycetota bacterium]MBU1942084.1 CDP-alcohol phosphatidyltransferase family protein [Actinomycetota bacterium]MBU2687345.1 CDP-alcohol phosphatidyltransferase family protein [Actinomycetota bacterium]